LSTSIDWIGSNELTVVDPGPGAAVNVELTRRSAADSMIRTWLAPKSVLTLAPSGQPAPPSAPVRLTWRKVARLWLVAAAAATAWTVLMNLDSDGSDDLSVFGVLAGVSLAVALIVAVVAIAVRGTSGGPRPDDD
jgi:hypothetical protein